MIVKVQYVAAGCDAKWLGAQYSWSLLWWYLKREVFFVIHDALIVQPSDMNSDIQRR